MSYEGLLCSNLNALVTDDFMGIVRYPSQASGPQLGSFFCGFSPAAGSHLGLWVLLVGGQDFREPDKAVSFPLLSKMPSFIPQLLMLSRRRILMP